MVPHGYYNRNVDMDIILSIMSECDAKYFMDVSTTIPIRKSYFIKSHIHDPATPTYLEALSGQHVDEYYK